MQALVFAQSWREKAYSCAQQTKKYDEMRMELFIKEGGLLITMTSVSDNFYAPNRLMADDTNGLISEARSRLVVSWKALFISISVHVLGVVIVIFASQWHLVEKEPIKSTPLPAPVQATLYFPPEPVRQVPAETVINTPTIETSKAADTVPTITEQTIPQPIQKEQVTKEVAPPPKQQTKTDTLPAATPQTPAVQTTPNQRAGRLNLSPKDAATQYFGGYHQQQIQKEAEQAASAYQKRKNSPDLIDTRKGQPIEVEPPRPVKKVNCASTTNKVFTLLSGIAGGTLQCTQMDDHKRFIDARINKKPREGQ